MLNYPVEKQPLEVHKMFSSNVSKWNLHIHNVIQIRLDLSDGVIYPSERIHGAQEASRSLELLQNQANILVVDYLLLVHDNSGPHENFSGHFHLALRSFIIW